MLNRKDLERLIQVETNLKGQNYKGISEKLDLINQEQIKNSERVKELCDRLSKIEDTNKWLWRTVMGAILLGSLNIFLGV